MPRHPYHHHGADRWDVEALASGIRFYHGADHDAAASPDEPARDERLRVLVDSLPANERHMVERTQFAGVTLTIASDEIGVSRTTGARLLRDGLGRLKGWLEAGDPPGPGDHVIPPPPETQVSIEVQPDCSFEHPRWGRCRRPEKAHGLCASHLFWLRSGITPDDAYHRRVVEGHRGVHEFLSDAEMEALVNGRYRGDGRRLDQYITHDPLGFMPWAGMEDE